MIEREADRRDAGMYDRAMARMPRGAVEPAPERERTAPRERETSGEFRSSEPVYGREADLSGPPAISRSRKIATNRRG